MRQRMDDARRNGVISPYETVLTPEDERRNVKMEQRVQLRKAAERGNWQQIASLLTQGMDINADVGSMTALMAAAKCGQIEVIQKLLALGADREKRDQYNNTALSYAARYGQENALQVLLEHGANKEIKNGMGATIIDLALIGKHHKVYQFLKAQGITVNICQALSADDDALVRKLLAQGADINTTYPSGNPLAFKEEKAGLVAMNIGFSTSSTEMFYTALQQQTPLEIAVELRRWTAAEFLIAHGANINQQDKSGWTPLMRAVNRTHIEAVRFLLHHSARTDIKTREGKDILSVLVYKESAQEKEIVRLLREAMANTQKK